MAGETAVSRAGVLVWLLLASAVGCGPATGEPKQPDFDPVARIGDEDPNVDTKKAKVLIEKGVAALRDGKLEEARKHLLAAEPFADELKRGEIRQVRTSIDEAEAEKMAPDINESAEEGACEDAIDTIVQVGESRKDTQIPKFLKERTSSKLVRCLLVRLKADVTEGRALADDPKVEAALTEEGLKKFRAKVTDAAVTALMARFDELLKERKWADAKKLLDELLASKEAGPREQARIMDVIRNGVAEDVASKVNSGLASKTGVDAVIREIDELVAVAGWTPPGGAVGAEVMPEDVDKGRKALALWAVCAELRCSLVEPSEAWALGDLELKPVTDVKGETVRKIEHASKLWRLADSSGWVLVTRKDPGKLDGVPARERVAVGWVKASGLESKDTGEWLPPGDSILGTRVWGPLRKGQDTYELGKVIKVKGGDLAVERMADRTIITIPRGQVRFGTITKGTKVLAMCEKDKLTPTPAVIDEVSFPKLGDPIAKITCLDASGNPGGMSREDQLGALRSKAAWLPPRK